jgi:hypothetical protein
VNVSNNPYAAPALIAGRHPEAIDASVIERLVTGSGTEDLVVYDVSDHQLYGQKHRQLLSGDAARRAAEAGFDGKVYQSVLWWCLVVIPVFPLGVYAVIPKTICDDPDGDADQYRVVRLQWDYRQVVFQYCLVFGVLLPIVFIACRWSWTS